MDGGTWLVVPHPWACGSTLGIRLEQSFIQIAAKGFFEPQVTIAVACSNVKFGTYLDIDRQRARDFHLP